MRTLGRLSGVLAIVVALTIVSVERLDDRPPVPSATRVLDSCLVSRQAIPLLQVVTRLNARELRERQRFERELARQQASLCAALERSPTSGG